jgi:hypothetical protein
MIQRRLHHSLPVTLPALRTLELRQPEQQHQQNQQHQDLLRAVQLPQRVLLQYLQLPRLQLTAELDVEVHSLTQS